MSFINSKKFLVLAMTLFGFALSSCGGKSTKADKPMIESETKAHDHKDGHKCDGKCDGKCDKKGHEGHKCDGKCDGKCDKKGHEEPKVSAESAANLLPNDGTRQIGDVTKCPVTGEVFTVSADSPKVDHDGKTYYFCCGGCVGKFEADPAKFLNKVEGADAVSALPNDGTRQVGDVTKCPVSGKTIIVAADSPKVDHDGKTYYFCCGGCVKKFSAEPAKYL